jgi:hypothetical protein
MPSDTAGLTLDSSGSSPSIADTGGAGTGGFSSWSKSKKTGAAVAGFLVLAGGAYFLAKRKSSTSTSTSSTTPVTVTGATTGTGGGNGGNVLAGLLGIGTGVTNLANALSQQKASTESITNNYITNAAAPAPAPSANSSQASAPPASSLPGYGAGLGSLLALNPGLLSANSPGGQNIPGITGYNVSYNGVPL